MQSILITNNPMVNERYGAQIETKYEENFAYLDILTYTRDQIHLGHQLLTHPLSSSIKPNETPYKSILISKARGAVDFDSIKLIEESIDSCKKFQENRKTPNWTEQIKQDFMLIDCDLIGYPMEQALKGNQ